MWSPPKRWQHRLLRKIRLDEYMSKWEAIVVNTNKGGRVRLPKKVIAALKIKDGDRVVFLMRPAAKAAFLVPGCEAFKSIRLMTRP